MPNPTPSCTVIGAGLGGLATAIRLAARGAQVDVLEANAYPGGKLSAFDLEGFRFDAGPSLFTMPQYVDELLALAPPGGQPFRYERLPVVCHYFWDNGRTLDAHADPSAFAKAIEVAFGVPAARLKAFLGAAREKYALTGKTFLEHPLQRPGTWWSADVAKALARLHRLDLFASMDEVHRRFFGQWPELVQLFNRFATYNGSNPYKAPGLLSMIPHFEHGIGAFLPEKGMHDITEQLYAAALRLGVRFHFDTRAEQILLDGRRVAGVAHSKGRQAADIVVSNMDVYHTYKRLLPGQPHPERTLRQERSTSALIFYWGVGQRFGQLGVHNIFFSQDYRAEFEALERGEVHDDATVYVNITSKMVPGDAPEGQENWFVMVNVPPNTGQDWDTLAARLRQQVVGKLSRVLGTDIAPLIRCEALLDPRSIEAKTASYQGSLYGTSSNNRMAAFLRHSNASSRLKGLYFVGGSVHPGGGIPLALLSGKIADGLIAEHFGLPSAKAKQEA